MKINRCSIIRYAFSIVAIVFVTVSPERCFAQASALKLDNINQLFAYLDRCLTPVPGSEGSEITLRFSLTHDGALRGQPMITYSNLVGSLEIQRRFVETALDDLEKCAPIPMTETFGKVVSQKMILWKAHSGKRYGI